jgi:hypothetical protein
MLAPCASKIEFATCRRVWNVIFGSPARSNNGRKCRRRKLLLRIGPPAESLKTYRSDLYRQIFLLLRDEFRLVVADMTSARRSTGCRRRTCGGAEIIGRVSVPVVRLFAICTRPFPDAQRH